MQNLSSSPEKIKSEKNSARRTVHFDLKSCSQEQLYDLLYSSLDVHVEQLNKGKTSLLKM